MQNRNLTVWVDPATEACVSVERWLVTEPVGEQFIEHPRSLWLLWNYFKKVGIRSVMQKLRSRLAEQVRNKKVSGLAVGFVMEPSEVLGLSPGDRIMFFACNHSPLAEVISVHRAFMIPVEDAGGSSEGGTQKSNKMREIPAGLRAYIGWSPYAGIPIDADVIRKQLEKIRGEVLVTKSSVRMPPAESRTEMRDQLNVASEPRNKPTAVLFGLGNYAKTAVLPNIRPYLSLERVHEVDPDQLAYFGSRSSVSLDTSPYPRPGLSFDAWFIAGYHHTHADLAIAALDQGAYAVIEKPLATTREQYQSFLTAAGKTETSRFFLCFHKRYSELHTFAAADLNLSDGEPVDMHCTVYEIPLPRLHWYNWPNSGSRLISNGCHWIDYFMHVNGFASAVDFRVWRPRGSDVSVQIRLENGGYLVMSLTDVGSQRLGVRDHIELRKGGTTVKMVDAMLYEAENRNRVFRRGRSNPVNAYARMYRTISKAIAAGDSGDSLESLRSSELTLRLEEET